MSDTSTPDTERRLAPPAEGAADETVAGGGEAPVESSERATRVDPPGSRPVSSRDSGESTLLSAPLPADRYEADLEERLLRLERAITRLSGRIESIEAREALAKAERAARPDPASESRRTLVFWALVLLGFVVIWMIFGRGSGG